MEEIYKLKLLIVDDEPELLAMVKNILLGAGFINILTAGNYREARIMFANDRPDAAILDVTLPDGDGFSLFKELRKERDVPILFLSARDEDENRLKGLGLGADDYIVKPFLPRELVLRLMAVLRRVYRSGASTIEQEFQIITLGDTEVDWGSGIVTTKAGQQTLTAKEYALLKKLYDNRGNIVTIDSLCQAAWGDDSFGYENTLMVHIRRLREKIELEPSAPKHLLTIRGLGYRLTKEQSYEK